MIFFSLLQDGPHGLHTVVTPPEEEVADSNSYDIDWEVAEDPVLMAHLLHNNPQGWEEENPFIVTPSTLAHVPCEPPEAPLICLLHHELPDVQHSLTAL